MLCEICTAIFSGGTTSNYIYKTPGKANIAHFFMALDHSIFGEKEALEAALSRYMQELRESNKAEGQARIYTHGEKEFYARQRVKAEGVAVNEKTYAEMKAIAEYTGTTALLPVPTDL